MVSWESLQHQLELLEKAHRRLMDALRRDPDEFIRDSVIQRFEFTFELLWKAIKRTAEFELLECMSPKTCFKLAFQMDLIRNEAVFLDMLECRNLTSHTYDEENAETVYRFVAEKGAPAMADITILLRERILRLKD